MFIVSEMFPSPSNACRIRIRDIFPDQTPTTPLYTPLQAKEQEMMKLEEEVQRKRKALHESTLSGTANNRVQSEPLDAHQSQKYARVLAATSSREPSFQLST